MNCTINNEVGINHQTSETTYLTPLVDITERAEEYVLAAEMPGVAKEDLEILLDHNELTLVGRRSRRQPAGQALHVESTGRDYRRTFLLDPVIDTARISAQIEQGLLTVRLPKAEKVKPRRVEVN